MLFNAVLFVCLRKLTILLAIALILHLAHILWGTFQLINIQWVVLAQSQIFPESRRISPQKLAKFPNTDVGMFKLCFPDNNTPLTISAYDTIIPDTNHV